MAVATPSALFKMISIPEALEIVLGQAEPLPAHTVCFQRALHRTLAADVLAAEPVPGYRASIKDGYAVHAADGPGEYDVAFEAHAGTSPQPLAPGSVAYIGTGGPLPEGADAVVQIEDTATVAPRGGGAPWRVKILRRVQPGHDVRQVGSDVAVGEVAVGAGSRVGAPEVGVLATVGATSVAVRRAAHVAVLSTGDEVVEPSAPSLPPGKVRDANRAMLLAAAAAAGADATDLGIAADSAAGVEAALDAALAAGADVLLTTGGVSMGDKDFVKPLLERRGTVFFGKVCMKPGKPLTFARVPPAAPGGRPLLVFGLPGNPASSLVTFHLVVVPCLRKLEGWADPSLRRVHVRTASDLKMDPERPEYHRAVARWALPPGAAAGALGGELVAHSTGGQISSRVLSLRAANVLLEVPRAKGVLPAGTVLSALVIGDLGEMPQPEAGATLQLAAP